jgi:hypothetical protein
LFRPQGFPFLLLFKENKIYRYTGGLELNETLDFLSGENFVDADVYDSNLMNFYLDKSGQNSLFAKLHLWGVSALKWCQT